MRPTDRITETEVKTAMTQLGNKALGIDMLKDTILKKASDNA